MRHQVPQAVVLQRQPVVIVAVAFEAADRVLVEDGHGRAALGRHARHVAQRLVDAVGLARGQELGVVDLVAHRRIHRLERGLGAGGAVAGAGHDDLLQADRVHRLRGRGQRDRGGQGQEDGGRSEGSGEGRRRGR